MHKIKSERAQNHSLVNCDNKTNHCNRYVSNGLFSDQNGSRRSKLSNDDENSHPINASNTNNKSERKRNINMLLAEEQREKVEGKDNMNAVNCSVGCDDDDGGDYTKRIKVDSDGQDNNKSKMYQVRKENSLLSFPKPLSLSHLPSNNTIHLPSPPPHRFFSYFLCVCFGMNDAMRRNVFNHDGE